MQKFNVYQHFILGRNERADGLCKFHEQQWKWQKSCQKDEILFHRQTIHHTFRDNVIPISRSGVLWLRHYFFLLTQDLSTCQGISGCICYGNSSTGKVLSPLEACFDFISSPSPSMKIQIVGGKSTENLGFKSLLRKVKIC